MNAGSQNRPLGDDEIARLEELLDAADPDDSMVVDELDGFLAALACCPEPVPRDEWLPVVLGGAAADPAAHESLVQLVDRHHRAIMGMLYDAEGLTPVLSFDDDGVARGNAWAIGFVRGMALRPDAWAALEADDDYADALDPVMRLVAEAESEALRAERNGGASPEDAGDAEDEWEPIADEEREEVLHAMFDGVQDVYDFFREQRERNLAPAAPIRRGSAKIGRNDFCACGSGRKFKHCCGAQH
jgi:uncharacterized protein